MPRSKAQNEAIRAERRKVILEAAIFRFASHGFSATTMSEVARAAGVSHGTLFLYFPSKEALFEAALKEPLAEHLGTILSALRADGTPLERIRRMVTEMVAAAARHDSFPQLTQYVLVNRSRFPDLVEALSQFSAAHTAELSDVIRAGQAAGELGPGDPEHTAWAFFAWFNGIALVIDAPASDPFWTTAPEYGLRIFAPVGAKEQPV